MASIKIIDNDYFADLEKSKETWKQNHDSVSDAELTASEIMDLNSDTSEQKRQQLYDLYAKRKNSNLSQEERQQMESLKTELKDVLQSEMDTYKNEIDRLKSGNVDAMTQSIIDANQQKYDELNAILNSSSGSFSPKNMQEVSNRLGYDQLPQVFSASNIDEINKLKEQYGAKFGLDIANYQYPVDYKAVKAAGIDYVIIQWGGRGSSGGRYVDGGLSEEQIRQNVMEAVDAGLDVGIYTWGQPVNEAEAVEEANWTIDFLNSLPENYRSSLNMPVCYDYEAFDGRTAGVSREQHTANINAFNKVLADNGYETMTYSGRSSGFGSNIYGDQVLSDTNSNWVAEYGADNKYDGEYSMWQYRSDGAVDGVGGSGRADLNVYYEK